VNVDETFPSKYLKASDLPDHDLVVTIADVVEETMWNEGRKAVKWVIHFERATKGLVANVTNLRMIRRLHGPETDGWRGKRILLGKSWVWSPDGKVEGVRVRKTVPPARERNSVSRIDHDARPVDMTQDQIDDWDGVPDSPSDEVPANSNGQPH
jgi:hypothetical protein